MIILNIKKYKSVAVEMFRNGDSIVNTSVNLLSLLLLI